MYIKLSNGVDDVNTVIPHFPDPNVFSSHHNDNTTSISELPTFSRAQEKLGNRTT